MSNDRPVQSLKRKSDRKVRSSGAQAMVKGKRPEYPRSGKTPGTTRLDFRHRPVKSGCELPPGKLMKRPGQPSPAKPIPALLSFPWWPERRPARLMNYQKALALIWNT